MKLTETEIKKLAPREKRYDVFDDRVTGLCIRVEKTGDKTWYLCYAHPVTKKRSMRKLGLYAHLTLAQAREKAQTYMSTLLLTQEDPAEVVKRQREKITLGTIITEHYFPWLEQHRKSVRQTKGILRSFSDFYPRFADELTPSDIDRWKAENKRLNPKTINRKLASLQSVLGWAVKRDLITTNPLRGKTERLKEGEGKIRYLTPEERAALLSELYKRDETEKDYFKCAVLVSLNTGVRKGTLLNLRWEYVDFKKKTLYLPAEIMKGGKKKYIPLNVTALKVLREWKSRSKPNQSTDYIFPGEEPGTHLGDTKRPWETLMRRAGIQCFRWHDMRHDFASQLAMRGTDILAIKELMCHEVLAMTLIYAHLSPHHLEKAVEGLSELYNK
jgi:integrase